METKNTSEHIHQQDDDLRKLELFFAIRAGLNKWRSWRKNRGVEPEMRETIAMHSGKLMRAAQFFCISHPELKLDLFKMSKMALFHDIAEYKEKDYVPGEISKEEKYKRERAVIVDLVPYFGEEVLTLWEEFEEWKTPEAKILKQLDKLDAAIRALEYERQWYTNHRMDEFYPDAMSKLEHPDLIKIFQILLKKKYNHINYIDQYYFLLKYNWDEKLFDETMIESLNNNETSI